MGQTGVEDVVFVSGKACGMVVTVDGLSYGIGFTSLPACGHLLLLCMLHFILFFLSPPPPSSF